MAVVEPKTQQQWVEDAVKQWLKLRVRNGEKENEEKDKKREERVKERIVTEGDGKE